ncbi:hypothetical protein EDC39_1125 [Geothermobacter ehrlichii]|uniref:Uncharacterized protein n=1 Tax=Geothermobacter ehrlichii TaxID=213224 RepID=A0A5D3WFQ3_9BACT|nr:AbrB/MazE/SpoVT family DNA-binding domain-containing protein [Geothermobacter ehrlichii]TYO96717.1 hypothetical protein EDC39_1125 [Geothermobacter ehrlichii]
MKVTIKGQVTIPKHVREKSTCNTDVREGIRPLLCPIFFIDAHAAVSQLPLLSRDRARFQTYFPTVELITPDTTP